MTKFDLFLELFYATSHLLKGGITNPNVQEVYQMMEYSFDRFEELEGVEDSELGTTLDGITIKLMEIPTNLKEYAPVLTTFQNENEIYPQAVPKKFGTQTIEQVQLMVELFIIFNDLLEIGMNSCHVHEARMKIENLFNCYIIANKSETLLQA